MSGFRAIQRRRLGPPLDNEQLRERAVLVLVETRQRAVLITPVCPMSYGRRAISRLLKISS